MTTKCVVCNVTTKNVKCILTHFFSAELSTKRRLKA